MTPRLPNKAGGLDETQNEFLEDSGRRQQLQQQKLADMRDMQLNQLISMS